MTRAVGDAPRKACGAGAELTERSRRMWAATEARALGHGGIALVERATGMSRSTIQRGVRELDGERTRCRRVGRRRRAVAGERATALDPTLLAISTRWWSRRRPAIPTRRCGGCCKSVADAGGRAAGAGPSGQPTVVADCCTGWATACKATSRHAKAGSIRIGMRSFATSPRRVRGRSGTSSRRSRSTPRRRNWSAISRMPAGRGGREGDPAGPRP